VAAMTDHFQQKDTVVHERFGDETVIVSLETGCYFSLQGTADAIWALAANGHSERQILDRICEAFTGDPSENTSATAAFLEELIAERLLDRIHNGRLVDGKPTVLLGGAFVKPRLLKYTDMEDLLQIDPIHQVDEVGWPNAKPPAA
jgi:hypothetical protein